MKVEREAKAAPYCRDCGAWIELQSDWPICKSCHAKNPRVDCGGSLQCDLNQLRAQVSEVFEVLSDLSGRFAAIERRLGIFTSVPVKSSNFTGSRNDLGEPYFD
jgi:hypothetical protein